MPEGYHAMDSMTADVVNFRNIHDSTIEIIELPKPCEYIGYGDNMYEEKLKDIMPTTTFNDKTFYINYTAKTSDYRDIIESAYDKAYNSYLSMLTAYRFEADKVLILKKI